MENCQYCNAEFENKRAKAAHETHKCKKRPQSDCGCKDGGDWAVLSSNISTFDVSPFIGRINPDTGKSYKRICMDCGEVI